MQLKNGAWKTPLYTSAQFALAILATVATLAVTLDNSDWLEVSCSVGNAKAANWSRLAISSRGLRPQPGWPALTIACGAEFVSGSHAELATWTAVSWLLVAACVASSASLVLLVLGSSLAARRRRPSFCWMPVAFLILDLVSAALLSCVVVIAGVSAGRIANFHSVRPTALAGSTFPPQLAAVVAATVACIAGAVALALRRVLLATRAYDVALAATTAAASSSSSSTSSDAMAAAAAAARGKSATISSGVSAYQAGECVDDCICEVVASVGDNLCCDTYEVYGDGLKGWDNCGMDTRLGFVDDSAAA